MQCTAGRGDSGGVRETALAVSVHAREHGRPAREEVLDPLGVLVLITGDAREDEVARPVRSSPGTGDHMIEVQRHGAGSGAPVVAVDAGAPVAFEVQAGRATGFTEAPRGALFHEIALDAEGRVEHASILTPTAQNCENLEADMRILAERLVADGTERDDVQLEIEKLVRAYDPCLSCSVH